MGDALTISGTAQKKGRTIGLTEDKGVNIVFARRKNTKDKGVTIPRTK